MITKIIVKRDRWLPLIFGILALAVGSALGFFISKVPSPVLALGGVAGLGVALATFTNAEIGLLALIVMTYTRFSDVMIKHHGFPSTAQPFIALLGVAIIFQWVFRDTPPKGWMRSTVLVVGYGLVGLFSLVYAADFERAQTAIADYVKDAIIAIIVTLLLQRGAMLRRAIWALLTAGIFMGTLSAIQQLTRAWGNNFGGFAEAAVQNIIGETSGYRIAGPVGDPNFYAQIMLVLVPLALDRVWNEKNVYLRLIAGWALGAAILSILFSYSRGGFVGLMIVLLIMFLRRPPKLLPFLLTIVLVVPLLQFVPANYIERISTIPDSLPFVGSDPRTEVSFRGRSSETKVAWQMFLDRPILGVGLDNYPVYYQEYSRKLGVDPRREAREPHDLYLEIAAQTGIIGLFVFGILMWVMFSGMVRASQVFRQIHLPDYANITIAFFIGMIGYMVAAIFLHGAYPRYFWMLFGLAIALPQIANNEKEAIKEENAFVAQGTLND